jgi:hypothetical protein
MNNEAHPPILRASSLLYSCEDTDTYYGTLLHEDEVALQNAL